MLNERLDEKQLDRGYGIYLGEQALQDGKITVLPLPAFCRRLAAGEIAGKN